MKKTCLWHAFRPLLRDRGGNFATITAVIAVPLMLSVGLGVDASRYMSAAQHGQELADIVALSAASSSERDSEKLRQLAENFLNANKSGRHVADIHIAKFEATTELLQVQLNGTFEVTFMGLAGYDRMPFSVSAFAERAMSAGAVEVALVLDNTDSMNQDNKIGALKTAASNLANELLKEKDANVRVSLVPYGELINVGTQHRNAPWISVPENYDKVVTTEVAAVEAKEGYWKDGYKNGACLEWKTTPAKEVEKDGVWVDVPASTTCAKYEQIYVGKVWVKPVEAKPATTKTTTTAYRWYGCVGSRVSASKLVLEDGKDSIKYPGFVDVRQYCLTEILPLTDDRAAVDKAIKGMITSRPSYTPQTYIPGGMMWGINVLSPQAPFTEGAAFDAENVKPRKVIVLMTDGLNTRRVNLTGTLNLDYPVKGGAQIGNTNTANATQRVLTNTDTLTLCKYAKAQKIEIFTVAFAVEDAAAKTMLQACATDAQHYYDASDASKLLAAFGGIAQSLRVVRLTH
ncbi:MAG TPA: TadE/TadG family type IV pilus assembly protein [Mesorhizobium sp.]|jgi:Flp pilus assembly protein TadG|nr:TadE/TadG family type IV pilus assembly protein [Mesorhizobium sp.]